MKRLTREWVQKAEDDLRLARVGSTQKPPVHDGVCFHCQQSAEKYLKAILQECGNVVEKTHNLNDLWSALLSDYPILRRFRPRLKVLTKYAVDYRYPSERANKRQATAALRCMDDLRSVARRLLGLRP
jgi:HEPN domain-containing protein